MRIANSNNDSESLSIPSSEFEELLEFKMWLIKIKHKALNSSFENWFKTYLLDSFEQTQGEIDEIIKEKTKRNFETE